MSADDERQRRLAAIQARLNPPSSENPPSASSDASPGTTTPLFGNSGLNTPPRNLPKPWSRPSEAKERERKRELLRTLQRSIVRDNGYRQAAGCVETLIKIATNIQNNNDDKFRTLKGDNSVLRNKVLSVKGGREFLILMGFHTETRNFVQFFILDQSDRRMYELGLATEVLREVLPDLESRQAGLNTSITNHKAEEAARVAAARRQIEADREVVKDRTDRERVGRQAREAHERAQAEAAAREAQHSVVDYRPQAPIPGGNVLGGAPTPVERAGEAAATAHEAAAGNGSETHDLDDTEPPSYDTLGDFRHRGGESYYAPPPEEDEEAGDDDESTVQWGRRYTGHRWGQGTRLGE